MHFSSLSSVVSPKSFNSSLSPKTDSGIFNKTQKHVSAKSSINLEQGKFSKSFFEASQFKPDFYLEQIEKDIKSLDQSFNFMWDDELTLVFAAKCIKQATHKLKELKDQISSFSVKDKNGNKLFLMLKNLEKSLISREKIVKDSEDSIKLQQQKISEKFNQLEIENQKIKREKELIEENWVKINEENARVAEQMWKLDNKYSLIMETIGKFNDKNSKNEEKSIQKNLDKDEYKENGDERKSIIIEKEEIQKEKEKIKAEKSEVIKMKQELEIETDKYQKERKDFLKIRAQFEELSQRTLNIHNSLETQQLKLKETENLYAQLDEITELKKSLLDSQEQLSNEKQIFQQEYSNKLEEVINSHKSLKLKFEELLTKEKILENFSLYLDKERKEFGDQIKMAKDAEIVRESFEQLKMKWEDLQSEYSERSKMLEIREFLVGIQEKSLLCIENEDKMSLIEIYSNVKDRLQAILDEESQVLKIQRHAVKVKKENEITGELLQTIHEELIGQQNYLESEYGKLKQERSDLERIYLKLESQAKKVQEKEEEILDLVL